MTTAPILTTTDLRNGDGATATLSGGSGSAVNTVMVLPWRKTCLFGTWYEAGSRTGDGQCVLSVEPGIYFAHVRSTVGTATYLSGITQFACTSGLEPVHYRCLFALRDILLGLSLIDLTEKNVKALKRPMRIPDIIGPVGAIVSPAVETRARQDNARDEMGYTAQIVLFRASNKDISTDHLSAWLGWREQLTNALSQTMLPGVPEIHTVDCIPGSIMLPDLFDSQYDASGQLFRCYTNVINKVYPPNP